MDERAEEEEAISGCEGDDDIAECRIVLDEVSKAAPAVKGMRDCHIDRVSGAPQGNDVAETKQEYRGAVSHLGSLWTVTERTNGDDEENGDVQLENNIEYDSTGTVEVHEREGIVACVLCG